MPNPMIPATGGAMPGRRGFLRQLCTLPMLGGGVALLGAPTAVAEPVTPQLIEAYHRWLELERFLLVEEMPEPESPIHRGANAAIANLAAQGHYLDADAIRRAEQRVADIEAEFRARWCHFRARASLGGKVHQSPVDRHYLSRDMAIVSPPASSRAALVLSAVGVNWRG